MTQPGTAPLLGLREPRAFLISLARRPDRRERFYKRWARLGMTLPEPEWFPAVDGLAIPEEERWKGLTSQPMRTVNAVYDTPGAYGCYLSHLALLRQWATEGGQRDLIVFEDDTVLASDFRTRFQTFVRSLPAEWDLLYLGGSLWDKPIRLGNHCKVTMLGTTAHYVVRGTAVERLACLLDNWQTRLPLDVMYGEMTKRGTLVAYCPPAALAAQHAGRSDITEYAHWDRIAPIVDLPAEPRYLNPHNFDGF